ncbi:MAG TPA: dehydrogenase [Desulfotomaculum sp.]|nr:dehydrogenase [Desulfotomaculum sp.]
MKGIEEQIRATSSQLLAAGDVQLVIGYGAGSDNTKTMPVFIKRAEDVGKLVFNPFCVSNLANYLLQWNNFDGKIAIVVKGCDSRSIIRLLQDKQIEREKIIVLGVNCPGQLKSGQAEAKMPVDAIVSEATADNSGFKLQTSGGLITFSLDEGLLEKCRQCESSRPVISDHLFGEKGFEADKADLQFNDVAALEDAPLEEKSRYWDKYFERCLRCYACRNSCPACSCRECVFDMVEPDWVAKTVNLSDNTAFHLIRAFHVAGRCTDCGECERVCPAEIPLRVLNRKIIKDIKELFGAPMPGSDLEALPALSFYSLDDPESQN